VLFDADDLDEVDVYGHDEDTGVELTSYTFEVLMNNNVQQN